MELQPGQNISVSQHNPAPDTLEISLGWEPAQTPLTLDSSAFALNAQGKVRGDQDFIFYNQLALPGGGIERAADGRRFTVTFARLPSDLERIVVALTLDTGSTGGSFGQLSQVRAELRDGASKTVLAAFPLATKNMPETALIVGELYRRNSEWKFRAVGQGFVGGLAPLARQYGVDVAEDAPSAEPPPPVPVKPAAPARPVSAPPPAPVRLDKITLDKKGSSISLEKKGQGFEELVINLNWNQGSSANKGFFSRLTGSGKVDLDLGCLFRLRDGRAGAVQALGDSFGSLQQPPYIQLMGDDRSGASAQGEFLYINGRQWAQIEKVVVFAFIYEGTPNWAETDAVVTIQTPGQPTLEIRLDSHHREHRMCGLVLLENQGGNIQVTKLVEYFRDHRVLDQAYHFGLRWVAGSKD